MPTSKTTIARRDFITDAPLPVPPEVESLRSLDTAALREELSNQLALTAAHLVKLAWIVRILEERGEDLSDLRFGLLGYLRRIAYGQVDADLVVRYSDSQLALKLASALPPPEQKRLAQGDPVKMVVRAAGGGYDHRMVDPLALRREQLHQVFAADHVRDEAEQVLYLEGSTPPPAAPSIERHGRIKIDRKRNQIKVGRISLHPHEVVEALAMLNSGNEEAPEIDDDQGKVQIMVMVTEDQQKSLRIAAANAGLRSPGALIRRSLIALGLM